MAAEMTAGGGVGEGRSGWGAAWRAGVVVVVAVGLVGAGAWGGSHLVGYDDRLGMVAAVPAAFVVGPLAVLWLRAANGHIAAPFLGTLLAVLSGAQLWHDHPGVYADGALHPVRSGFGAYEEALLAAGAVAVLAGILIAAVCGHLRPRVDGERATAD